ncbi:hypothetical protein GM903_23320, partial [Salmonella enterica subsp. enterica serovar Derby]|nr:hypothetical protein [Salmonella enterica subsp. enterica serovar Derby]
IPAADCIDVGLMTSKHLLGSSASVLAYFGIRHLKKGFISTGVIKIICWFLPLFLAIAQGRLLPPLAITNFAFVLR